MATILGDRTAIYSCAFVQGAVAVIFAAFTGVFVNRYHLTLPQYGVLFIPQFLAVVAVALLSASLCCRLPTRAAYRLGLSCSLLGMAPLIATEWTQNSGVTYPLLLVSTVFVGAGFAFTFPHIRCYAVCFKPLRSRRQALLVNGLLAAGLAASPAYALLTRGTSAWWSLPVLLAILLIAELLLSRSLRVPPDGAPMKMAERPAPSRYFRAYPALAMLYGICAVIALTASQHLAGSALHIHMNLLVLAEVAFWAALVDGSRVAFAMIDGMSSRPRAASMGIFNIAIVVLILAVIFTRYDVMHVALYLLAAISCAALLPIDTRPGNEHIMIFPHAVAGGLMALFPVGVGLSGYIYNLFTAIGVSAFAFFISLAVVGVSACILLLPIILRWRTMGYFDQPGSRHAQPPGVGRSGAAAMPGPLAAPPPRPRDRPADDSERRAGGASALPRAPQRRSGRHGQ